MNDATKKPVRVNWQNLLTVGSAAVLVGSMIVALGLATGWAIAGALGLGDNGARAAEVICVIVALIGIRAFWRMATRVEPVIER
jgi:hypothetical protein